MTKRAILQLLGCLIMLALPFNAGAISDPDRHAVNNNTVWYDPYAVDCGAGTPAANGGAVGATGTDNEETIWNNLIAKGLQPFQVAGIMGNMQSESGFDPLIIQGGGHSNNPADAGGGGYGLVQWTPGAKLIPLLHGQPPGVVSEISGLWEQLTTGSEKSAGDAVRGSKTIEEATAAFELKYERHAGGAQPARLAQAKAIYQLAQDKHWASAPTGAPPSGDLGAAPSICAAANTINTTGGCTNPFAAGTFGLSRTDDGVDYTSTSPQPLLAVCDMTVIKAAPDEGWGPDSSFIYAKLTSGPFAGKCWYYAEHLDKKDLPAARPYKAGEHIATLVPGGWELEVGFAKAYSLAATSVGQGGYPSVSGIAAAKFLRSLGAKTREDPGPGPAVYGGGSCP